MTGRTISQIGNSERGAMGVRIRLPHATTCMASARFTGGTHLRPRMRLALSAGSLYEWRVIRSERGPTLPRCGLGEHLIGVHLLAYAVKM